MKEESSSKDFERGWKGLAVFDLDKTLVVNNCSFAFCQYLVSRGVLPCTALFLAYFYYLRHTLLGMCLLDLHRHVFDALLRGRRLSSLEQHVQPFLKRYLCVKEYAPVVSELNLAQQRGFYTVILSSSPSFLVKDIAQHFQVNEWFSTEYAIDKEGRLCHIARMMQGEEKALIVQQIAHRLCIPLQSVVAYSDSLLDLPLLSLVGVAVASNPDRRLRRFAKNHHWKIL